jgi:rubrerythrin
MARLRPRDEQKTFRKIAHDVFNKKPSQKSWYCDQCHVEVYERRCPHCGKTKNERR